MTNKVKVEINDSTTSYNNNMSVSLESDKTSMDTLVKIAKEMIKHKKERRKHAAPK